MSARGDFSILNIAGTNRVSLFFKIALERCRRTLHVDDRMVSLSLLLCAVF